MLKHITIFTIFTIQESVMRCNISAFWCCPHLLLLLRPVLCRYSLRVFTMCRSAKMITFRLGHLTSLVCNPVGRQLALVFQHWGTGVSQSHITKGSQPTVWSVWKYDAFLVWKHRVVLQVGEIKVLHIFGRSLHDGVKQFKNAITVSCENRPKHERCHVHICSETTQVASWFLSVASNHLEPFCLQNR